MKFSTIAVTAALSKFSLAAVYDIKLYAESTDSAVGGKALSSIHEGAGLNYFFLGDSPETLSYDDRTGIIHSDKSTVGIADIFLGLGVSTFGKATFENDILSIEGNSEFYAAKNVNDPYNYSENSYAVTAFTNKKVPEGAIKISIKKSGSPSVPPLPSSSASLSSSASAPYGNSTVTQTTVTYTCLSQTVVTITSCPETVTDCPARKTPTVVTTNVEVTLTTTYCPASTTPILTTILPPATSPATAVPGSTSAKPTTVVPGSTSAKSSTVAPAITTANGAARAGAGAVAGMAAIAAWMI
ncbi:cell wall protein Pga31p [[Candida] anglica]|uniref:Cell wall protein Pga31p n=1 Tax=[Candida] anglica TaxID=148631 RepID=A0ABP0EL63_9ASCO